MTSGRNPIIRLQRENGFGELVLTLPGLFTSCANIDRSFFESNACLYGPQRDLGSTWFTPSSCRRDGPRHMKRAISLSDEQRYVNNPALVGFLQKTLQVRTVDWRLLLKELEWKKYTERKDAPEILDIYQRLSRCLRKATSDEQKKIR
jgi:hypothetical protein